MRFRLISSISARITLWSPRMFVIVLSELSIRHCMRVSVSFMILSTMLLSKFSDMRSCNVLRCLSRMRVYEVQCKTRCILSSLSDLHKGHVAETECWLNFALFACNVYVPVMSLALMFAFVTARTLFGIECHSWCECLFKCLGSARYFRDVLSFMSLCHSVCRCSSKALFNSCFHWCLVGGLSIILYAVGRLYFCRSFLICVNQLWLRWSFKASCLLAISYSMNPLLVVML